MREQSPRDGATTSATDWAPPAWVGEPTPNANPEPEVEKFSLPAQEVPRDLWQPRDARPVTKSSVRHGKPLRLGVALPVIILLALLSAFFSWVSAEPLWLALGHGTEGTATVTRCIGEGLAQRCSGELSGARVTLLGVTEELARSGAKITVQRVSEESHRAYAGGLFLRWFLGMLLVVGCGAGIALVTGVRRMTDRRERLAALGTSFAAPFLVTIGFLAASF